MEQVVLCYAFIMLLNPFAEHRQVADRDHRRENNEREDSPSERPMLPEPLGVLSADVRDDEPDDEPADKEPSDGMRQYRQSADQDPERDGARVVILDSDVDGVRIDGRDEEHE